MMVNVLIHQAKDEQQYWDYHLYANLLMLDDIAMSNYLHLYNQKMVNVPKNCLCGSVLDHQVSVRHN